MTTLLLIIECELKMPYPIKVQTLKARNIPHTKFSNFSKYEKLVKLGDTQYITVIEDPNKPRNRYLVKLLNSFTGQEQQVDLVIQESGFMAMMIEIRKHLGCSWEVFSWQSLRHSAEESLKTKNTVIRDFSEAGNTTS